MDTVISKEKKVLERVISSTFGRFYKICKEGTVQLQRRKDFSQSCLNDSLPKDIVNPPSLTCSITD